MGRVCLSRGTGRTAGSADSLQPESQYKGLSLHKAKRKVHISGQPPFSVSVQSAAGYLLLDALYQVIPEHTFFLRFFLHPLHGPSDCGAESHNPGNIFRAGSPPSLLRAAVNQRKKLCSSANVKHSHSLWAVQLVCTGAEHIHLQRFHVQRNLPQSLDGIRVEQYPFLPGNGSDFFNRFKGTDLIVGSHDTDQNGIRPNGRFQLIHFNHAFPVYVQIGYLIPFFLQILTGMKNCMMFYLRGNDMSPFCATALRSRLQRPVVRLRPSGGKIDFLLTRSYGGGNRPPGFVYSLFPCAPKRIHGAGIAVIFRIKGQHGFYHLRRRPGGGGIVQIYHLPFLLFSFLSLCGSAA